jgi:hypothetical protein
MESLSSFLVLTMVRIPIRSQLTFAAAVDTRDASSTAMLAGAGMNPMGPAQDMAKPFKAEVENLALAEGLYKWAGEGVEDRVLAKWGKV